MLKFLSALKRGECEGVKVRLGRLQNLLSSSCVEHLDFLANVNLDSLAVEPLDELLGHYAGYQSLTDIPARLAAEDGQEENDKNYASLYKVQSQIPVRQLHSL